MRKYMYFAKNTVWPQDKLGRMHFRNALATWYRSIENSTVDTGGPLRAVATTRSPGRSSRKCKNPLIDGYGIIEAEDADAAKAILENSPLVQHYGAHFDLYEMLPGLRDY
jgi:hypothetical protein